MTSAGDKVVIGFQGPLDGFDGRQALAGLQIAAERIGCRLIHVATSEDLIAGGLDFALVGFPGQPKTTDVPTFCALHAPRDDLADPEDRLGRLLTYDGYLAIAEPLERFVRGLCAGLDRVGDVGSYASTPQRSDRAADLGALLAEGRLRLCLWDDGGEDRNRAVLRKLAWRDDAVTLVPGPAPEGPDGRAGGPARGEAVASDGHALQARYAACGVGLVLLSKACLLDGIVSGRLFEIVSVGGVAICPDIPWIRDHFGDTVFYYPPAAASGEVATRVGEVMATIRQDVGAATVMARAARGIFEARFAAEHMLGNAIAFFKEWRGRRESAVRRLPPASIDVIVRVGSRPLSTVLRTIVSLDAQRAGEITVVFVRFRPIDLAPIVKRGWTRIKAFRIVDAMGGHRAATLCAGLKAVRADLFAVLDDDDFLLDGHVEHLLHAGRAAPPGAMLCCSGAIDVDERGDVAEPRSLALIREPAGDTLELLGSFRSNTFLASSALLGGLSLDGWGLATAEDSLLIALLVRKAEVTFTFRATACVAVGRHDASNYDTAPSRPEDLLELLLRIGPGLDLRRKLWGPQRDTFALWRDAMAAAALARSLAWDRLVGRLVLEDGAVTTRLADRDDLEVREVSLAEVFGRTGFADRLVEDQGQTLLRCLPDAAAWAFGATADIAGVLFAGPQWVVVEIVNPGGTAGVGVLDATGGGYEARTQSFPSSLPQELWLRLERADVGDLVFANWQEPLTVPITVRKISIARGCGDAGP